MGFSGITRFMRPVFVFLLSVLIFAGCNDGGGSKNENETGSEEQAFSVSITTVSPPIGASGVALDTVVRVTFSSEIDPASVTAATFGLTNGDETIAGVLSCTGNTAYFTPDIPLTADTTYLVRVSEGIRDLSGKTLDTGRVWAFTTTVSPMSNSQVMDMTELLRGDWDLSCTIMDETFHHVYTLDAMSSQKNYQGGPLINGTNASNEPVTASYWPSHGYWTLVDPGDTFVRYYVFYTDGVSILEESCYYQLNNSTGVKSECFPLSGSKIKSVPTSVSNAAGNGDDAPRYQVIEDGESLQVNIHSLLEMTFHSLLDQRAFAE